MGSRPSKKKDPPTSVSTGSDEEKHESGNAPPGERGRSSKSEDMDEDDEELDEAGWKEPTPSNDDQNPTSSVHKDNFSGAGGESQPKDTSEASVTVPESMGRNQPTSVNPEVPNAGHTAPSSGDDHRPEDRRNVRDHDSSESGDNPVNAGWKPGAKRRTSVDKGGRPSSKNNGIYGAQDKVCPKCGFCSQMEKKSVIDPRDLKWIKNEPQEDVHTVHLDTWMKENTKISRIKSTNSANGNGFFKETAHDRKGNLAGKQAGLVRLTAVRQHNSLEIIHTPYPNYDELLQFESVLSDTNACAPSNQ